MSDETPWAVVQRLKGAGATFDTIVVALQQQGLAREDLELLLQDDPQFLAWSRGQAPAAALTAPLPPPPSTPGDSVRLIRWAGITLSMIVCGLIAAAAQTAIGLALAIAALLPAMGLLAAELSKGLRRTARPLGFVFFFAFFAPVLTGFIGGWRLPQVLCAPLFLLSVPLIVWASRTGERLKGLTEFAHGDVFENGEVQFAVSWPQAQLGPGETLDLRVHAQNCVDVARSLTIKVRGDLRSNLAPFEHTLQLDPGCIVEATVPVRVPPLAPARFGFTIDLVGSGTTVGRRVRLAKGAEWVTPAESLAANLLGVATLATVGAGRFSLGSNETITVKVDTEKAFATSERKFEHKELYRPDDATLQAAATS